MPAVTNGYPLRQVFELAQSRRVDLALISDSNGVGLSSRPGWFHGIQYALVKCNLHLPMYATGVVGLGDNAQLAQFQDVWRLLSGSEYVNGTTMTALGVAGGDPGTFDDVLVEGNGTETAYHAWTVTKAGLDAANKRGPAILIRAASQQQSVFGEVIADISETMKGHLQYGLFSSGAGSFNPNFGYASGSLASAGQISPSGTDGTWSTVELDLPAGSRSSQVYFSPNRYASSGYNLQDRVLVRYARVEWPEKAAGFAMNFLMNVSGGSARNALEHLYNTPANTAGWRQQWLEWVTMLQAGAPYIVYIINHGLNDRGDGGSSLGPTGGLTSSTKEGYKDNLLGLIAGARADCVTRGIPLSNAFFWLIPSHPVTPEHAALVSYREAAAEIAESDSHVIASDISQTPGCSGADIDANGWYDAGGDAHLTKGGHEQVALALVNEIMKSEPSGAGGRRRRSLIFFGS